MAVEKDHGYLNRQRQFVDEEGKASVGVGVIDGEGNQSGTMENAVPVRLLGGDSAIDIVNELRMIRMHLAHMTGETFTSES